MEHPYYRHPPGGEVNPSTTFSRPPTRLQWSQIENRTDTHPTPQSGSWDDLVTLLTRPRVSATKEGPGWLPVVFKEGAQGRTNEDVKQITLLVLDVDGELELDGLAEQLKGKNWLVHTSYSHAADDPHWRIVCPLQTPFAPKGVKTALRQLAGWLGVKADEKCFHPARFYYVPTVHPERMGNWHVAYATQGENLSWKEPTDEQQGELTDESELHPMSDLIMSYLNNPHPTTPTQPHYNCVSSTNVHATHSPPPPYRLSGMDFVEEMVLREQLTQLVVPGSQYVPSRTGQRYGCLLNLARLVRRIVSRWGVLPPRSRLGLAREAFMRFWTHASPVGKPTTGPENWDKFLTMLADPELDTTPSELQLPPNLTLEQIGELLAQSDGTFFLATTDVAAYFQISRMTAHAKIQKLLKKGIWKRVRKGNRRLASVYAVV